jgi:hypothetical protein
MMNASECREWSDVSYIRSDLNLGIVNDGTRGGRAASGTRTTSGVRAPKEVARAKRRMALHRCNAVSYWESVCAPQFRKRYSARGACRSTISLATAMTISASARCGTPGLVYSPIP